MCVTAAMSRCNASSKTECVKKTGDRIAGFFMPLKRDGAGAFVGPGVGQLQLPGETE